MPDRYHQANHLHTKYTNELFRLIDSSEIPIAEFELNRKLVPLAWSHIHIGNIYGRWKDHDWPVTTIIHQKTKSFFAVAQLDPVTFTGWSQVDGVGPEYPPAGLRIDPKYKGQWNGIAKGVETWVGAVKEAIKNLRDLWEELNQGRDLLDGEPGQNIENT